MIPFICGFVIGGMFGVTVTALCAVSADKPTAPHVIVSDPDTDCATGYCTCGHCGEPIDYWDAYCRNCGMELEDA